MDGYAYRDKKVGVFVRFRLRRFMQTIFFGHFLAGNLGQYKGD
jgi:hypothetical protein